MVVTYTKDASGNTVPVNPSSTPQATANEYAGALPTPNNTVNTTDQYIAPAGMPGYSGNKRLVLNPNYKVSTGDIKPTTDINLPSKNPPTNYNGAITGANASLANPLSQLGYTLDANNNWVYTAPKTETTPTTNTPSTLDNIKTALGLMTKPTNMLDAYKQAEQDAGIQAKQNLVSSLTGQLNSITAKSQADQLAVTGQGRGIPEVIIGGQQAQISKEAAIQALPISAQLSAAQGDLQMAQEHLKTYFNIFQQDIQNQQDYQNKVASVVINYMDKAEQRTYEAKKTEDDRKYQEKRDSINYAQSIATKALENGQSSIYKAITSLDPNSPNYNKEVARLGSQIYIPKKGTDNSPTIKSINGVDMQWDGKKWVTPTVGGSTGSGKELQLAQSEQSINDINSLVKSPYIRSAVGPTAIGRFVGRGLDSLTGERQNYIATVEKLRSQLSLDSLINAKAKGATFGALSDTEMRILSASASKLGTWAKTNSKGEVTGYSASEKAFNKELETINNFAKLDYVKKGGDPLAVGVQVMPNGKYVVQNSDGSYTEL